MQHRNLGRSGLRVSAVGLGCNNFGGRIGLEESRAVVHAALDAGITLFDTADVYGERGGSETALGEILGARRQDIVLATKCAMPMSDDDAPGLEKRGASRRYVTQAVEASLKRLRTDWIDLYQIHRPDPLTPIEETLRALDDLVRAGKVRYVGCSNFAPWQVADAQWTAREIGSTAFVSCQDELSLVVRGAERELIPCMERFGLGLLPYFPLASGLLTGKYRRNSTLPEGTRLANTQRLAERYLTDRNWPIAERLGDVAERAGRSMTELAFSWLLSRPTVSSVIAGATRPEQVRENAAAAGWTLSAEELAAVDEAAPAG